MNDLISRSALLADLQEYLNQEVTDGMQFTDMGEGIDLAMEQVKEAPTVDAEPVRHEGNTTFITTDNLDAYADRIIVRQGNWCKVYYRDSDDAEVEG